MPGLNKHHRVLATSLRFASPAITVYQGKVQYTTDNGVTWTDETSSPMHSCALMQWMESRKYTEIPTTIDDATDAVNPFPSIASSFGRPDSIDVDFTGITYFTLPTCTVVAAFAGSTLTPFTGFSYSHTPERTGISSSILEGRHRLYLAKREYITYTSAQFSAEHKLTIDGIWAVHGIERSSGLVDKNWTAIHYINNQTIVTFASANDAGGKLLVSPRVIVGAVVLDTDRIYIDAEYPIKMVDGDGALVADNYVLNGGKTIVNAAAFRDKYLGFLVDESMVIPVSATEYEFVVSTVVGGSIGAAGTKIRMTGAPARVSSSTETTVGSTPQTFGDVRIIRVSDLPSIQFADPNVIYRLENTKFLYQLNATGDGYTVLNIDLPITMEQWVGVPATPNSAGVKGQKAYGNGYLYECVATNVWIKQAATFNW